MCPPTRDAQGIWTQSEGLQEPSRHVLEQKDTFGISMQRDLYAYIIGLFLVDSHFPAPIGPMKCG